MGSRPEYAKKVLIWLQPLQGRPHYIELRWDPERGPKKRWSGGYKVWVGGEFIEVVRYDDDPAHEGTLHRHGPSLEGQLDTLGGITSWFPGVPINRRGACILKDVRDHMMEWSRSLPQIDPLQLLPKGNV